MNRIKEVFDTCNLTYDPSAKYDLIQEIISNETNTAPFILSGLEVEVYDARTVKINPGAAVLKDFTIVEFKESKFLRLENKFSYLQFYPFSYQDTFFVVLTNEKKPKFYLASPKLYSRSKEVFLGIITTKENNVTSVADSILLEENYFNRKYICKYITDTFGIEPGQYIPPTQLNGNNCYSEHITNFTDGTIVHNLKTKDISCVITEVLSGEQVLPNTIKVINENSIQLNFIPEIKDANVTIFGCNANI